MGKINTQDDFYKRLQVQDNGCIEYTGFKNPLGYGIFSYQKKHWLAHRLAMVLKGYDLKDLLVCHTCDNPCCCNTEHLFLGTQADNNKDRTVKGRTAKGSNAGKAVLTETQVLAIRNSTLSAKQLAQQFMIHEQTIYAIRNGRSWAWLQK